MLKRQRGRERIKIALKPVFRLEFMGPFKSQLPVPRKIGQAGLQSEPVYLVFDIIIYRIRSAVFGYLPLRKTGDADFGKEFIIDGQVLADAIIKGEMRARRDIHIFLLMMDFIGSGHCQCRALLLVKIVGGVYP